VHERSVLFGRRRQFDEHGLLDVSSRATWSVFVSDEVPAVGGGAFLPAIYARGFLRRSL